MRGRVESEDKDKPRENCGSPGQRGQELSPRKRVRRPGETAVVTKRAPAREEGGRKPGKGSIPRTKGRLCMKKGVTNWVKWSDWAITVGLKLNHRIQENVKLWMT